jgi:hypothetical protein
MKALVAVLLAIVCNGRAGPPPAPPPAMAPCMSDERQFGTTCCRSERARGEHRALVCRGPQLGKPCQKASDCDIQCGCDPAYLQKDGQTGVTGTCIGYLPPGEWLCTLNESGRVSSLIID